MSGAIGVAASLVVAVVVGLSALAAIAPSDRNPGERPMRLGMGLALGLGLSGIVYFGAAVAAPDRRGAWLFGEGALVLGAAVVVVRSRARVRLPASKSGGRLTRQTAFLAGLFGAAVVFAATFFVGNVRAQPGGGIDAVAVWNLRGRVLSTGGRAFVDYFDAVRRVSAAEYPLSWNWDYPVLLPSALARAARYGGGFGPVASALVAAAFATAVVLIVFGAVRLMSDSRDRALMAGLLLVGTPFFTVNASALYADVPLAAFSSAAFASTLIAVARHDARWSIAAGAFAGLAAFTKNDGLLHFGAVAAATLLARGPAPIRARRGAGFLVGAAPGLAALAVYRVRLAGPRNWLLVGTNGTSDLPTIGLVERARAIGRAARDFALHGWGWSPALALVLVAAVVLCAGTGHAETRFPGLAFFSVAGIGIVAVYLLTRYDVTWQLSVSLDRLLLQFWPAAIIAIFGARQRTLLPAGAA